MKPLATYLLIATVLYSSACSSAKQTSTSGGQSGVQAAEQDGSSFEHAIVVGGIKEEYSWVRSHYPGSAFQGQSLMFKKDKPFDVLNFRLSDGTTRSIYFDISSFYGKY